VLLFWASGIALMIVLIVEGRWRDLTRRIDLGSKVVVCGLLLWFVFGGRIFVTEAADQTAKAALVLIAVMIACQVAFHVWRLRERIHPPEAQRG
jgi:hypothetical protein